MRLSQTAIADAVGVSMAAISAYECRGMTPTLPIAINIVNALDWSISDWEGDARKIMMDNSWRRVERRGKMEKADDYE